MDRVRRSDDDSETVPKVGTYRAYPGKNDTLALEVRYCTTEKGKEDSPSAGVIVNMPEDTSKVDWEGVLHTGPGFHCHIEIKKNSSLAPGPEGH